MSWQDYALARQYLVETRIGTRIREAKHVEDQKAKAARAQLTKASRGR